MGAQSFLEEVKEKTFLILTSNNPSHLCLIGPFVSLTRATALSVMKPDARLPTKPPTSKALM